MCATLLILEDESEMRWFVTRILEPTGHRVIEAANGPQALALIQKKRPDIVILDIFLPGPSGLEVLEVLKSQPATAEIPVIMLTAAAKGDYIARATQLGAVGYIVKPFSPSQLVRKIEEILRGLSLGLYGPD